MDINRDILIFMETRHGEVRSSSLELFGAARAVSEKTGGKINAVIIGYNTEPAVKTVLQYEPERIILLDSPEFAEYSVSVYTNALYSVAWKYRPDALMLSATKLGKSLAPRLARRLKTGITANCTELSAGPDSGIISWNMPAPGGIMATILCMEDRPQMGSICPGAFKIPAPSSAPSPAEVIREEVETAADDGVRLLERIINDVASEKSITDAKIVVAGGRGMGSAENFRLVYKLAELLDAAVGASRVVVDAEWVDQSHLIGQTGKIIRPDLYIACGISGALQHMVGVENAGCIVAINRDESAPIFNYADYSVVGDVNKILPALIASLEKK